MAPTTPTARAVKSAEHGARTCHAARDALDGRPHKPMKSGSRYSPAPTGKPKNALPARQLTKVGMQANLDARQHFTTPGHASGGKLSAMGKLIAGGHSNVGRATATGSVQADDVAPGYGSMAAPSGARYMSDAALPANGGPSI